MTKRKQQHLIKQQRLEAECELKRLRGSIDGAYNRFNSLTDPAMLEACILEIGSLQTSYRCMLKNIKTIYGE